MKKNKIRDSIRDLIPGYIISFVASFMLYIYEPIVTYSTNMNDFWFDFWLMLPNIFLYSIVIFFGISIIYTFIYLVDKICFKKERIYKAIFVISWIIFVFIYIQGNYLTGSLPVLDKTTINWNGFFKENIISLIILSVIIISEIIAIKKSKYKKVMRTNIYITLAIFIMLLSSFVSALCTPNMFKEKTIATATNKNLNNVSSDRNFFIFTVDAVDSREFASVLEEESSKYSETFKDFTYFPDTVSGYAFTRDSIPFILSGKWNKNEKEFTEYYNEAFDNSKLFKILKDKNYNMNLYEPEIYCNRKNAEMFDNVVVDVDGIDKSAFFKQWSKYVLFKYLPYQFKRYSKIETVDFESCKISNEITSYFNWLNSEEYNYLINEKINVESYKYFKFIHVEGGHVPFDYDEELNKISEETGTYRMKLKATLKLVDEFINKLKESNVYDNSVIIVMADHGYWAQTGRQNPILYIKGVDEHHEMLTSEIPVSFEDLVDAYEQLLNDQKSTELFKNIDENRTRKYIYNSFMGEDNMIEYEVNGKAWDSSAITETGVEYNR